MSSIQSPNLFLLVAFFCRLLGNRVWPVKGVRSRCNTLQSKRCHGNSNAVKVRLYSLLFDNKYDLKLIKIGTFFKYSVLMCSLFDMYFMQMIMYCNSMKCLGKPCFQMGVRGAIDKFAEFFSH